MHRRFNKQPFTNLLLTGTLLLLGTAGANAQNAPNKTGQGDLANVHHVDFVAMNKMAVSKSLTLLQRSAATFVKESQGTCFSCHSQSLPAMAVALCRERGFPTDATQTREQKAFVQGIFAKVSPLLKQAETSVAADKEADLILVDPSISVGYALAEAQAEGWANDATTQSAAAYLMRKQLPDGHWPVFSGRPPMEGSEFASTALAVRALKEYAPKSKSAATLQQIERAKTWLTNTRPKTGEDRTFRLFGLKWAGAGTKEIQQAVTELLERQNDDGGWSQLPHLASDVYATGQALVALHQAGGLPTTDAVYARGALYLFATQQEDGSWQVAKRAIGVQPYFESGYPHGKDQFISIAGGCWATMALALAVPVAPSANAAQITASAH